ncbi:putative reverse transcriptase domain-containing protein [Tanacetum coccineum]
MKKEMRMISKDGIISKFPGYTSSKEEEEEEDEEEEEEEDEEEPPGYAAIDNEVESDLESTTRSEPKCKKMEDTLSNNVNNANANGGNRGTGGNNGCSYKTLLACNPRDYDGKGGAVALTRWIEKMELVIENSRCFENQKVKYAASSFINKALTWWNTQVQARGREAAIGYTDRFHELAKLVPHLSAILKAGILTDEAVCCDTLTRSSEKRKEVEETSKQGGSWKDNKKAKVGKGFVATAPPRNENVGSYSKYAKCSAYHPEDGPLIMEYLVNISKRHAFWSLNEDILKINDSEDQYAVVHDRPKIEEKGSFELKGQFLKELRENTFSGSDNEDANGHIEKVLEIVDLFHEDLKTKFLNKYCPPGRTAKKIEEINNFQQEPDETLYQAWERFKELLMKCPQYYLTKMQEVILFYNGLDVPTRQILNSRGVVPTKTAVEAKKAIQEMAEYS